MSKLLSISFMFRKTEPAFTLRRPVTGTILRTEAALSGRFLVDCFTDSAGTILRTAAALSGRFLVDCCTDCSTGPILRTASALSGRFLRFLY